MNSKLTRDLSELVAAKVISPEISQNISNYYISQAQQRPNRLFAIFGVLGALLVGLGVILILAHNWDDFSRTTKTIWAFTPLVIGQAFAAFTLFKKKSAAWKETAATFLFFAIGASISLVSQIYNIPGSMPSFLLTWIILAAPLVYLLRSHAAAMLFVVFATVFACNVGYFNSGTPWYYLMMLLWMLPHYLQQLNRFPAANITGILNWMLPLSVVICLGAFVSGSDRMGFLMYVLLFGLFYNLGKLSFFGHQKLRTNGYLILGSLGTVYTLVMTTFQWVWSDALDFTYDVQDVVVCLVLGLAAIGVLGYSFLKKQVENFNLYQYAFLIFTLIFVFGSSPIELAVILTNLLVFALGIFAVRLGARSGRYSILNYGLLVITVLIACRFFDTDISFVIRGLLFVSIGAGFFAANYLMHKKQQQQNTLNNE